MLRNSLRSILAPPRFEEDLRPDQWRSLAVLHTLLALMAVGIDVALLFGMRGRAGIDQQALAIFGWINLPLLMVLLGHQLLLYRVRRLQRVAFMIPAAVIVAVTVLVWVQLTGTVTSYFIVAGLVMILLYRLFLSYWCAVSVAAAFVLIHSLMVGLELGGVLRPASLFLGPPGPAYANRIYHLFAIISIDGIYVFALIGGNVAVNKLREKDRAIAEARARAANLAAEMQHGRLTGRVVGERYALSELLGRGGMGEVYVARRLADDNEVAVKVLHGHLLASRTALERFRREAELASRIPIRHRAEVLEIGHDTAEDLHYLVLERLYGEDLGAALRRRGVLELPELLPLLRATAEALDAAHGVGVVHRDLKPQNIFLLRPAPRRGQRARAASLDAETLPEPGAASAPGSPVEVRLLDFGMSKALGDSDASLTQAGAVLGTLAYMAPEQALGSADVGAPADRFALAAVAYRALAGRPPFQAGEIISAIHEVVHVDPPPVSRFRTDLHRDVDAVLVIGLAKRPEDRYPSALAFVEDLALAAAGRPGEASRQRAQALSSSVSEAATVAAESAPAPSSEVARPADDPPADP